MEIAHVSIPRAFVKASVASALTSVPLLTTPASGQSPAARPDSTVAVSERPSGRGPARDGRTSRHPLPHHRQQTIGIGMASSSGKLPRTSNVPFLLKFNINTQLRYLNTQNSDETLHRPSGR